MSQVPVVYWQYVNMQYVNMQYVNMQYVNSCDCTFVVVLSVSHYS